MTGLDLKVARIRAHVKQRDLARVLQTTQQYVSQIESRGFVPPDLATRYLAGVDELSLAPDRVEPTAVAS